MIEYCEIFYEINGKDLVWSIKTEMRFYLAFLHMISLFSILHSQIIQPKKHLLNYWNTLLIERAHLINLACNGKCALSLLNNLNDKYCGHFRKLVMLYSILWLVYL